MTVTRAFTVETVGLGEVVSVERNPQYWYTGFVYAMQRSTRNLQRRTVRTSNKDHAGGCPAQYKCVRNQLHGRAVDDDGVEVLLQLGDQLVEAGAHQQVQRIAGSAACRQHPQR